MILPRPSSAIGRRRPRRTPGTGLGAVHEARSGGLYEDAICTQSGSLRSGGDSVAAKTVPSARRTR